MEKKIYVFGHRNPDTDSICSAIAYAELKRQLGQAGATAYRLGDINDETRFVLDYFDVQIPEILSDVGPTLNDLDIYKPQAISLDASIKEAWDQFKVTQKSRILSVVDKDDKYSGILSVSDLTDFFMENIDEDTVRQHTILFKNIIKVLDVTNIQGKYKYEKVEGKIYLTSRLKDVSLSDKDIVITGDEQLALKIAEEGKCGCLIITNGILPANIVSNCCVVSVETSLFKTINLINQSVSVGSLARRENIVAFALDSHVDDVIGIVQSSTYRNFPVMNANGEFAGLISRRHLIEYSKKNVILVDHNERSQSAEGIEQAEILEIIDHHRVADVQTDTPLFIRAEPLGSTATIVYKMFMETQAAITRKIAGMLISAILSDTLMFNSPTTTEDDKIAAKRLATIAEVDIDDFGRKMFSVSMSLKGSHPREILSVDRKRFAFGKNVVFISQVNTLDFKSIVEMGDELEKAMDEFVAESNCDLYILMITDVVECGTQLLVSGRA
ncbi:MAG: putative manganese-dependent inorganic diphosphatase, partial [Defluviitaleaceae bacterium]|nr:putative manganese-dependent inorganic diphosphatase [Defluviitaleaceae bacterium]